MKAKISVQIRRRILFHRDSVDCLLRSNDQNRILKTKVRVYPCFPLTTLHLLHFDRRLENLKTLKRLIKPKRAQNNATYLFLRIFTCWIPFPSTPPSVFYLQASLLFSPKDCRLLWKPTQFLVWNYHKSRDLSTFKVDFVDPEGDLVRRLQVRLDIHPVVLQRGLAHLRNSWELLNILPWKRIKRTLHK